MTLLSRELRGVRKGDGRRRLASGFESEPRLGCKGGAGIIEFLLQCFDGLLGSISVVVKRMVQEAYLSISSLVVRRQVG